MKKLITYSFGLSLIIHSIVLFSLFPNLKLFEFKEDERTPLKIKSIRTVGIKDSKTPNSVYLPPSIKTPDSQKDQALKGKDKKITFSDLQVQPKVNPRAQKEDLIPKPAIKSLSLNKRTLKNLLQSSPQAQNAGEFERAMGQSNVLIKLDVPEGVPEDELNKFELVFYSFRKRTALNYINSFYNQLNDFESKNPHLQFPMTKDREQMTGRVTYDDQGNVVRIKMIQWSDKKRLQDFFLTVLQEMNHLKNPPKVIVQNGEFHIYYSLTINEKI